MIRIRIRIKTFRIRYTAENKVLGCGDILRKLKHHNAGMGDKISYKKARKEKRTRTWASRYLCLVHVAAELLAVLAKCRVPGANSSS